MRAVDYVDLLTEAVHLLAISVRSSRNCSKGLAKVSQTFSLYR